MGAQTKLPPTAAYTKLPHTLGERFFLHIAGRQGHGPQGMSRRGELGGKLDQAKARLVDVPFWTEFAQLFASQVRGRVGETRHPYRARERR
jgi:hypothetical protein